MSENRITTISQQLMQTPEIIENQPDINWKPKHKWFKTDGWGYLDTKFILRENMSVLLTGNKYTFCNKNMPDVVDFCTKIAHVTFNQKNPIMPNQLHIAAPPIINYTFFDAISHKISRISFENNERVMHSYGHTLQEMFKLKYGKFDRYCDVVVYPNSTEQVLSLIKLANEHNVVLIPYGGGTNVTQDLMLFSSEKRMIASVDLCRMCKVKSVNKKSMTACIEAGILGSQLEAELSKYGLCLGHEPDSIEFSTLGGWISTRASGMKKNAYGNIEDIVVNVKLVTSKGIFEKSGDWQRVSNGPDLTQIVLGSEGMFGIITEAVVKVCLLPEKKEYDSILFHDFETGVKFVECLAKQKVFPASVRLVDNTQVRFALAFKEENTSTLDALIEKLKRYFVSSVKGFKLDKFCLLTLLYEGTVAEVNMQMKIIESLASQYNGLKGGADSGIRGYFLTFVIAYIRDFVMEHNFIAESFETTVPWEKIIDVCREATEQINKSCKKEGVKTAPFVTFRVSQIYNTCATVYCYFGYSCEGLSDAIATYSIVENEARECVMKNGGSLSHHHGIGKLRKHFVPQIMTNVGLGVLKSIKKEWDPNNIFAVNNIIG